MEDHSLSCIVAAIPESLSVNVNIPGGPHITLLYMGDKTIPEELFDDLCDVVDKVSSETSSTLYLEPFAVELFGHGDAIVLTLRNSGFLEDIRRAIISEMTPELLKLFEDSETFPVYRPHITLGYISNGDTFPTPSEIDELVETVITVRKFAIWNGFDVANYPLGDTLSHYGTPRHSGRYPWGSGEDPYQSAIGFMGAVAEMREQGMTNSQIAKAFDMKTPEFRAKVSISTEEIRAENVARAFRMRKERRMSNTAIAKELGVGEGTVRNYFQKYEEGVATKNRSTAELLKKELELGGYIDVGRGVEHYLGTSSTTLKTAVEMLKAEGYKVHYLKTRQLGTDKDTSTMVISKPDVPWKEVFENADQIRIPNVVSKDDGATYKTRQPPIAINPDRVSVVYGADGGGSADGLIHLRRGVPDISMGNARYAQVRILVDGGKYVKGMAVYSDDMPKGVDVVFHTDKKNTGNKLDALKPAEPNPLNPFGSAFKAGPEYTEGGKAKQSLLNVVNEEGDWANWSKKVSSQFLSKQNTELAKAQLDHTYALKVADLDEIKAITNPTIKRKMLEAFASSADSAAVHLKAASMPRSANYAILPLQSIKETEIYAPKYQQGEEVVLIRHPHGGIFEIPRLKVNNKNAEGNAMITKTSADAVGIHPNVAKILSGADFDGDSVLVIPTATRKIKNSPPLEGLKDFDPKVEYKGYEGMKVMSNTQTEMGIISNLIADMTIKGADDSEIARAVRHSMVVIDAEKHKLNYRLSAKNNQIAQLKKKYQDGGASTLITQASSNLRVPNRRPRYTTEGGPINTKTGELQYTPTGETYTDKNGKIQERFFNSTNMAETNDARTLMSSKTGTAIERIYADYANKNKALANEARLLLINTPRLKYDREAAIEYAPEVARLKAAHKVSVMHAPKERQAQIIANAKLRLVKAENPAMDKDAIKREGYRLLDAARVQTGASRDPILFSDREWEAVQKGAISDSMLEDLLRNVPDKHLKERALPKTKTGLVPSKLARAKAMAANGYTLAEIASALGVSSSTISKALN